MSCCNLQDKVALGHARAGQILGQPFAVCRTEGAKDLTDLLSFQVGSASAVFSNAKASGFNFDKGQGYEDILWSMMADPAGLLPGDFLVENVGYGGTPRIYFTVYSPPYVPPHAVLCNRFVTHLRANSQMDADGGVDQGLPSQPGSQGTYWGVSRQTPTAPEKPGETALVRNVPCAMVGTAGRATGTGEDPTGPPGPARWRFYLPVSCFPKGSVRDGDLLVDEEGNRHNVTAAVWTPLGYKPEAIREEVQG